MEDQEMEGNDILDICRRLNQITDELAAMADEEIRHGEDGETDDSVEEGGTFWMMSASKQLKLVGTAQSLIAGITDALRTATVDHSKVFEVMALLSVITDTIGGLPAARLMYDPSNLRATSLRYHFKMVSGRAAVATSLRALRPSRWPTSPSVIRSASESLKRPCN
jgi:hypothetical protein